MLWSWISRLSVFIAIATFALPAAADIDTAQKWTKHSNRLRASCGSEVNKFCANAPRGKEEFRCIFQNQPKLSPVCQSYMKTVRDKIIAHREKVKQMQRLPAGSVPLAPTTPKAGT